jgi:hypothetical protein
LKHEAQRILQAHNESESQPNFNLSLARVYLNGADHQEAGVNGLTQPLEHSLSDDEKPKLAGKLQDKTMKLGIREIVLLRLRVRGQIVEVDGLK